VKSILLFWVILSGSAWANDCGFKVNSPSSAFQNLSRTFASGSHQVYECAEQELVDGLVDPIRLQDFAMKQCELQAHCKNTLIEEVSRISRFRKERFSGYSTVALWAEIQKFSAYYRVPMIQISELPLSENPEVLFEKIKEERMNSRELNSSEKVAMACTALAAFIGPMKLKALKLGKTGRAQGVVPRAEESLAKFMEDFPILNPAQISIFKKFDQSKNSTFKARLAQFRGNDNIDFDPAMHGREGQIFTSKEFPNLAIKRFFVSHEMDPWEGVKMLEQANTVVQSQPKLNRVLSVVKVVEKGPDYIVREFDAKSVPLKSVLNKNEVVEAIKELKRELRFAKDIHLKKIYKKLDRDLPSENLHWSEEKKKILLIDITKLSLKTIVHLIS